MIQNALYSGPVSDNLDDYLLAYAEYQGTVSFYMKKEILAYPLGTASLSEEAKRNIELRAISVKQALFKFLEID